MNRRFSKEEIQMAKRHLKRCSISLITRAMQIKSTMRYHLIPFSMANIEKARDNKWWLECRGRGSLLYCQWECKLVQPLWIAIWRCLKKLKIEIPFDPQIPLLGIYPEKKVVRYKKTYAPYVYHSTIYNSQDMEAT